MRNKLECNSCGHVEMVDYEDVQFCPECGSSDVKFEMEPEVKSEVKPERESEVKPKFEPKIRSKEFPEVWGASYRSPTRSTHRRSLTSTGMSEGAKIRLVLGIIGAIMLLSAVVIFLSGMSEIFSGSFGRLTGLITLAVIGFILLAIATKGDICDCNCNC
ncbi:MAG: hypothetical protein ACFFDB_00790 [Promethearchaeota archaeon]